MKRYELIALVALLLFTISLESPLYDNPNILQLTPEQFEQKIENSLLDSSWFVHFYSHQSSKQLVEEWQLMAQSLSGLTNVKIAAVDDNEGKIGEAYEIYKYPAFAFISSTGEVKKFAGEKTANNFIEFVFEQVSQNGFQITTKRIAQQKETKSDQSSSNQNNEAVTVTDENFEKLVMSSNEMWFIDFYAPWCGPCMQMESAWNILAQKLNKQINVGKVNIDKEVTIRNKYNIQNLPTMVLFEKGNKRNAPYYLFQGNPNVWNWASWAIDRVKTDTNDMVILTQSNFDEILWNSDEMFFVKFYAPWCSHCNDMQPAWEKLASYLKSSGIKIAMVDTQAYPQLGQRFQINAWPVLRLFPAGRKSEGNWEDFNGERNPFEMANWLFDRKKDSQPLVSQIVNQKQFMGACKGLQSVCLLGFLPNIQDADKFTRLDQIDILNKITTNFKQFSMNVYWIQVGDYRELEDSFEGLEQQYPSIVAYNGKKNVYSIMDGQFNYEQIGKFIQKVFSNSIENVSHLEKEIPKLKTIDQWDGKDHKSTGSNKAQANVIFFYDNMFEQTVYEDL